MAQNEKMILYGRVGCHHCEQLQFALDLMKMRGQPPGLDDYQYIDIDSEPTLRDKYDHSVPVLVYGERVICEGAFDIEKLAEDLKSSFA